MSLVTVETFTGPIDAHLAKGRLEAEGIPAFVVNEHHVWANWTLSHALGGVRVQVASADAERATLILEEHAAGNFASDLEEEFPDLEGEPCPQCGSQDFESQRPVGMLALVVLTLGLINVIFPIRREMRTCTQFGARWRN